MVYGPLGLDIQRKDRIITALLYMAVLDFLEGMLGRIVYVNGSKDVLITTLFINFDFELEQGCIIWTLGVPI